MVSDEEERIDGYYTYIIHSLVFKKTKELLRLFIDGLNKTTPLAEGLDKTAGEHPQPPKKSETNPNEKGWLNCLIENKL